MADPVWVDTNTLGRIAEGDYVLEGELLQKRAAGSELLMVPKVKEEFLKGVNPFKPSKEGRNTGLSPEQMTAKQLVVQRLQIKEDFMGSRVDRLGGTMQPGPNGAPEPQPGLIDRGFTVKPPTATQPGRLQSFLGESDSIVLTQIAASAKARGIQKPVVFTLDGGMFKEANRWGVSAVTRSTTPPPRGSASMGTAPGEPMGPMGGGPPVGALIEGAHIIIKNGLTKISQQQAYDDAMAEYKREEPEIHKLLMGNPGLGVRIDFFFQFQPGVNTDFHDETFFEGLTYRPTGGPNEAGGVVQFELRPRGMIQHFHIWLPPDGSARRRSEKPPATPGAVIRTPEGWVENIKMYPDRDPRIKAALEAAKIGKSEFGTMDITLGKRLLVVDVQLFWNVCNVYGAKWVRTPDKE
jgi:hypothetical protein